MGKLIPDITTTVNVKVKSSDVDEALKRVQSDKYLSQMGDLIDELKQMKKKLRRLKKPLAYAVAQALKGNQETIISTKHFITGRMVGSVEITNSGSKYLVGNTATSDEGFPYPLAIEKGRRTVYPVNKKFLRWFDGGTPIFAKKSKAVAADPYVQYSIDETMSEIDSIVTKILEGAN